MSGWSKKACRSTKVVSHSQKRTRSANTYHAPRASCRVPTVAARAPTARRVHHMCGDHGTRCHHDRVGEDARGRWTLRRRMGSPPRSSSGATPSVGTGPHHSRFSPCGSPARHGDLRCEGKKKGWRPPCPVG